MKRILRLGPPGSDAILDPRVGDRKIEEIIFSSMPTADELRKGIKEDPVILRLYRNNATAGLIQISLNPRASWRWCALPEYALCIDKQSVLRVEIENPCTVTCLNLMSKSGKQSFSEIFRWEGERLTVCTTECLNEPSWSAETDWLSDEAQKLVDEYRSAA